MVRYWKNAPSPDHSTHHTLLPLKYEMIVGHPRAKFSLAGEEAQAKLKVTDRLLLLIGQFRCCPIRASKCFGALVVFLSLSYH